MTNVTRKAHLHAATVHQIVSLTCAELPRLATHWTAERWLDQIEHR